MLEVDTDGQVVSFLLVSRGGRMHASMFADKAGFSGSDRKKIADLASKLRDQGVEFDDSIYDESEFDGFSARWEHLQKAGVDMYT